MTAALGSADSAPGSTDLVESESGEWVLVRGGTSCRFDAAILGGFACDCTGRTLIQIVRLAELDANVQIGAACRADGNWNYRPFRRMPWMVESGMVQHRDWRCDVCDGQIGTFEMLDGVIVGVEVACPTCLKRHRIDLTLGSLPQDLRFSAFGIEQPPALVSLPAYDVLRRM